MIHRDRKLLDLARDQSCVNCKADDGTIVAAHSNELAHGKGRGIKGDDAMSAHLCHRCHAWVDQGKGTDPTGTWCDKTEFMRVMILRTHSRLWSLKLVRVA